MTSQWKYAGWGGLLGLGSPLGALALRWGLSGFEWPAAFWAAAELRQYPFFYVYQAVGTVAAFGAAGFAAGRRADCLDGLARRLNHLSAHDSLTGLYNRRTLLERLAEEFARARRARHPLCCLMIDLDRFKRLNDRYGHFAGDAVLIAAAARLKETARQGDVLGRLGGEEFLAILPATSAQEAVRLAERMRRRVADHLISVGEAAIRLRISVGVAEMAADDDPRRLLKRADDALYLAKAAGRNQVKAVVEAQPGEHRKQGD